MEDVATLRMVARTMSLEDLRRDRDICAGTASADGIYDQYEVQTVLMVVNAEITRRSFEEGFTQSWKSIKKSMMEVQKAIGNLYKSVENTSNQSKQGK